MAKTLTGILFLKPKCLVVVGIILLLINIILTLVDPKYTFKDFCGLGADHLKLKIILILIFGITLIGFIAGTILSLLPYKSQSYKQKYLSASLLLIFVLQLIYFIFELNDLASVYIIWSKNYC